MWMIHVSWLYVTSKRMHPNLITTNMNQTHKDIKFNPTHKSYGKINSLDLLLIRKPIKIEIDIFWKPTTADTTIDFSSNHPLEHKIAAFQWYITIMHSLPLTPKRQQKEWTIIQYIAQTNNLPYTLIQKLNSQLQHRQNNYNGNKNTNTDIKTWTTFTCSQDHQSISTHKCGNIFQELYYTIQHLTKPK
jgi:hypothetical protein